MDGNTKNRQFVDTGLGYCLNKLLSRLISQCSGTSPSHSMPEGFIEASGIQTFGDGVGDDGLAFFFQQFNQPLLLGHQGVDLRRLAVEKLTDEHLFGSRRNRQIEFIQVRLKQMRHAHSAFDSLDGVLHKRTFKKIKKKHTA